VGFSLQRVSVVAANTLTEAVRQKVIILFLLIGLVFIVLAVVLAQFTFGEQMKFIKDTSLGVISVITTLIAIVGTAQLLPSEVENRTIYTILAKPVRRFEFLLGKFCGGLLLVLLGMALMCVLFAAVLWVKEQGMIRELSQTYLGESPAAHLEAQQQIQQVQTEVWDVELVKALVAVLTQAALIASVTLLVSTFSTSLVFNVVVPLMVFIVGMLRGGAADMWGTHRLFMAVVAVIPDFGLFNIADEINLGKVVPWAHIGQIVAYGLGRTLVIVVAAHLLFARREI
jgi:hypothetical protein